MPILGSHPRIYPGHIAKLVAAKTANSPYWQDFQADKSGGSGWGSGQKRLRQYVWDWAGDPTTPKRDAMLAFLDEMLAWPIDQGHMLQYGGLVTGDWIEDLAFAYDWMNTECGSTRRAQMEDLMLLLLQCVYNSKEGIALQFTNADDLFLWGNDNPPSNYFYAKFKGAIFAYLAMYGSIPSTTNYPLGDPTNRYTWRMKLPNQQWTGDLGAWIDAWMVERCVPVLDTHMAGGGWHEGQHYGPSPYRNAFDMMRALKDAGGTDYAAGKSWWADRIMYNIFTALPGNITFDRGELDQQHYGSVRISTLIAVDELRANDPTNPALGWGQYWLRSNYSNTRIESAASWNPGHDVLFCDETDPGIDYKNIIQKGWFAEGCGQYISRKDWSSTDIAIGLSCFSRTEAHADADGLDAQIFRCGHAGPSAKEGWLLCDIKHGAGGNHWETFKHNSHTLGGGARSWEGNLPPAMGFQQRMDTGPGDLASVPRQCTRERFSYVQMECNDAYHAIPNQDWNNSGRDTTHYPPVSDVCMREFLHLRKIDVVLFYDRARMIGQWADPAQPGKDIAHFHYPRVEPFDSGSGVRKITNYENRMFRKFILPFSISSNPPSVFTADEIASPVAQCLPAFREDLTVPQVPSNGKLFSKFLLMLEIGDKDVLTDMTNVNPFESAAGLEGLTIKVTNGWYHVMFSTSQDGGIGSDLRYIAEHGFNTDRHIIVNLVPGAIYTIKRELISGTQYMMSLNQGGNISIAANEAGVIEFTTAQLMPAAEGRGGSTGGKKIPSDPNGS